MYTDRRVAHRGARTNPSTPQEDPLASRDPDHQPGPPPAGRDRAPAGAPPPGDHDSTRVRPPEPAAAPPEREAPAPPSGDRPVLGVVVIYSEAHEEAAADPDPRLGTVYPLRAGEVLLVGRPRQPRLEEVLRHDGTSIAPAHRHHFPHGEMYRYISRPHLTIEMDPRGGTILTDFSRYGVYLAGAGSWLRREDPDGTPPSHRVDGDETVVLMDGLGEPGDPALADRRSRYRLRIVRRPGTPATGPGPSGAEPTPPATEPTS